ncbi:glycosyltransferase [Pseudomonas purpurea]|uniref:glycosyltransferase n=1 Tax=Pseudomonas purpurea TaxID=3136737 RepID=UPI0032659BF8
MKKVLYTGAFRFPEGDAAAFRVQSIAGLFDSLGYSVSFAGWESSAAGAEYNYRGYRCYPQSEFRERKLGAVNRLLGFLFRGANTLRWLKSNRGFDVVVAYNPPALFALMLQFLAWKRKFTLILDSTEWYESAHLPGGRYGIAAVENWVRMRLVYPRFKNIICISAFLENYFSTNNVVRVPPLVSWPIEAVSRDPLRSCIKCIYAGEAGKKDQVLDFVRALPNISKKLNCRVIFTLLGQDWESLRSLIEEQGLVAQEYAPFVRCLGRVSRERVAAEYKASHFSILLREDSRYAHAGFPTKAMESWSHGCPIICNNVGDLGRLAVEFENAIVVDKKTIESQLIKAFQHIIGADLWPGMSDHSIGKARQCFESSVYQPSFGAFLERADDKFR